MKAVPAAQSHNMSMLDLRERRTKLWNEILCFVRDLMVFSNSKTAQDRLDTADQRFFFSEIHLKDGSPDGFKFILNLPGPTGVSLEQILQHKFNTGNDICAAHTWICPILKRFFKIPPNFTQDRHLKQLYKAFEKEWARQNK